MVIVLLRYVTIALTNSMTRNILQYHYQKHVLIVHYFPKASFRCNVNSISNVLSGFRVQRNKRLH